LLFFDEPFAGVDPKSRTDIAGIIRALSKRGVAVLITDHNAEAILRMVDRLYVMDHGSNLAEGTPDQVIANPAVRTRYLGDSFQI
jgi:lipopolysaccharide export system ATP-binding protein